jgi:serine/threonine protein kinase
VSDPKQSDNVVRAAILGTAVTGVVPLSDALKDLSFGPYELVACIGRGGMGEVFLSRSTHHGQTPRLVALKVLLKEVGRDKELVGMFMDEASIMSQIHHPNVLSVYDFGREQGHYFLAMEYLRGRPLVRVMIDAYVKHDGLAPEVIASIGADAARGLHAAHTAMGPNDFPLDVVHRDVSPQNIFVTFDGSAKMIDFGVARASERISRTTAGQLKGKAAYMSPEQIRGNLIDGQSDVFALATCLWEMMAGRRLFKRDTDYATMEAVLSFDVQAPSKLRPGDAQLDEIVLRALQREKKDRTENAGQFCAELDAFASKKIRGRSEERVAQLMSKLYGEIEKEERILIRELSRRAATEAETRALRELSGIAPIDHFTEEITMAGRPLELEELEQFGTWDATPTLISLTDDTTDEKQAPIIQEIMLDASMAEEVTSSNAEERAKAIQQSVAQLKSEHAQWLRQHRTTETYLAKLRALLQRKANTLLFVIALLTFAGAAGFYVNKKRQVTLRSEFKEGKTPVLILDTPIEITVPIDQAVEEGEAESPPSK